MYYQPSIKDTQLYIPHWCYEDTPVKYLHKDNQYYITDINYEVYRQKRKSSYFACHWYPELIKKDVPVIDSVLIRTDRLDIRQDLKEGMNNHPHYQFIRLCGCSPKDVVIQPIFSNYKLAADAIMHSQRTLNIMQNFAPHVCLFLRKVVNINKECRCFFHQHQLRAVSVYEYLEEEKRKEYEISIIKFFEIYSKYIPYNSCVIEIAMDNNGLLFTLIFTCKK